MTMITENIKKLPKYQRLGSSITNTILLSFFKQVIIYGQTIDELILSKHYTSILYNVKNGIDHMHSSSSVSCYIQINQKTTAKTKNEKIKDDWKLHHNTIFDYICSKDWNIIKLYIDTDQIDTVIIDDTFLFDVVTVDNVLCVIMLLLFCVSSKFCFNLCNVMVEQKKLLSLIALHLVFMSLLRETKM